MNPVGVADCHRRSSGLDPWRRRNFRILRHHNRHSQSCTRPPWHHCLDRIDMSPCWQLGSSDPLSVCISGFSVALRSTCLPKVCSCKRRVCRHHSCRSHSDSIQMYWTQTDTCRRRDSVREHRHSFHPGGIGKSHCWRLCSTRHCHIGRRRCTMRRLPARCTCTRFGPAVVVVDLFLRSIRRLWCRARSFHRNDPHIGSDRIHSCTRS